MGVFFKERKMIAVNKKVDDNFTLRQLKNMRKSNRKRRKDPKVSLRLTALNLVIKRKQMQYFITQKKVFENLFFKLLNKMNERTYNGR
jgi:hypothetical protein